MFYLLPPDLRTKTSNQPIVASDLARLLLIEKALNEGYRCVIWCDADFLIFAPDEFILSEDLYGFGREVWVQTADSSIQAGDDELTLKTYTKIHNAFMFFRAGNPFLSFYVDSIRRMLHKHQGPYVTQIAGPKFLSAIHNITQQPVVEIAAMLSPMVIRDLIAGEGPALRMFLQKSRVSPAGVNLCSSLIEKNEICNDELMQVLKLLLENPELLHVEPGESLRSGNQRP